MRRAPAESTSHTIRTCSASAASDARTIFSTVRAPHDPAFTIGSLATMIAGTPSIDPRPVTTPSAGSPLAMALASTASSTNEPSSTRRSMRSRAVSLPWPRIFSSARSSGVTARCTAS